MMQSAERERGRLLETHYTTEVPLTTVKHASHDVAVVYEDKETQWKCMNYEDLKTETDQTRNSADDET